jgi:hypothetical protein
MARLGLTLVVLFRFFSFEAFPWSIDTPLGLVVYVEESTSGHFYWPDPSIDLGIESIEHPERFPLRFE